VLPRATCGPLGVEQDEPATGLEAGPSKVVPRGEPGLAGAHDHHVDLAAVDVGRARGVDVSTQRAPPSASGEGAAVTGSPG
jgi:hypothetical protein